MGSPPPSSQASTSSIPAHGESVPPPPKFTPTSLLPLPPFVPPSNEDVPIISCPCPYNLAIFFTTMSRSILNPEVNSDLILRAEILSETSLLTSPPPLPPGSSEIEGFLPFRQVHRRLLPRQPKRDLPLAQLCTFYRSSSSSTIDNQGQNGIVEYRCLVEKEEDVPFYHPSVASLRFTYIANFTSATTTTTYPSPTTSSIDSDLEGGTLQISVQLFPSSSSSPPPLLKESSKLYRICLRLIGTLWKHGNGIMTGYEKRVQHDVVVQKEGFQDLYLELKEKYGGLESRVMEEGKEGKEDVKRHVWKDVAITTFLILLWRDLYPSLSTPRQPTDVSATSDDRSRWGAPPGGFIDIGAGNGLLVHVLTSEGYVGQGLELRPRKTWSRYPALTQSRLRKQAINPTVLLKQCAEEDGEGSPFEKGSFFIGNHADEMTPWIPVIAALTPESGFLNIPCCLHTLSARFNASHYNIPPSSIPPGRSQKQDVEKSLGVQAGGRYGAYLIFLAGLGWECGWEWEREALRIPSTRAWGIVGRRRLPLTPTQELSTRQHVLSLVERVRNGEGGGFKARRAEGKAGDLDEEEERRRLEEEHDHEGAKEEEGEGEGADRLVEELEKLALGLGA